MKRKGLIIALLVGCLLLVLGDGVQHSSAAWRDAKLMTIVNPHNESYETLRDALHEQYWSIADDALAIACLAVVIALLAKTQCERVAA